MRRLSYGVLILGILTLLTACDNRAARSQLESENRRLKEENKQLKENTGADQERPQHAATQGTRLEAEVRRLQSENNQLKALLENYQKAQEQSGAQRTQQPKPRRVIDLDQYKAELNQMIGWTKQQVAKKFGNPLATETGGNWWFYKFDAQDKFGVVYRHIQINFGFDSGRVESTSIGVMAVQPDER